LELPVRLSLSLYSKLIISKDLFSGKPFIVLPEEYFCICVYNDSEIVSNLLLCTFKVNNVFVEFLLAPKGFPISYFKFCFRTCKFKGSISLLSNNDFDISDKFSHV